METITIGKKEFNVEEVNLKQQELLFYAENPRVYSALRENGNDNPSQQEIEDKMRSMDHVKELRYQIKQNGGLIESLIVVQREEGYVVLEGNSRLAAYRILAEEDPIKWSLVRCSVLPDSITESEIFTLLGTLHLVKKKDWTVYEQAAYVYRQKEYSNLSVKTLAKSVGLSVPTVNKYIKVYEFMSKSGDTKQSNWNYYEQYVMNSGIDGYRTRYPEMDQEIVKQIQDGTIREAKDIRDKLGKIAKSPDKTSAKIMQDIIRGKASIDEGYSRFEATGKSGDSYKKIKEFRNLVTSKEFVTALKTEVAARDTSAQGAIKLELRKIEQAVSKLIKDIEKDKSSHE